MKTIAPIRYVQSILWWFPFLCLVAYGKFYFYTYKSIRRSLCHSSFSCGKWKCIRIIIIRCRLLRLTYGIEEMKSCTHIDAAAFFVAFLLLLFLASFFIVAHGIRTTLICVWTKQWQREPEWNCSCTSSDSSNANDTKLQSKPRCELISGLALPLSSRSMQMHHAIMSTTWHFTFHSLFLLFHK